MADGLLPRRGLVDGLQRQGDFDELLAGGCHQEKLQPESGSMVAGKYGLSPSDDFKFSLGLYRMIPAKASDDFQTINDLLNPLNDFFTIAI